MSLFILSPIFVLFLYIIVLLGPPPKRIHIDRDIRDVLVKKALKEVNTVSGDKYITALGYPEGVAWCSIFVCWVYTKVGIEVPEACGYSPKWFPEDKTLNDNKEALRGDVMGLYYNHLGRIGHTGILVEDWGTSNIITIVEGNISNKVVKKYRSKNQINIVSNWIN